MTFDGTTNGRVEEGNKIAATTNDSQKVEQQTQHYDAGTLYDIENDERVAMINKLLPLRLTSQVVRGFGRGSKDLGIPTANLDLDPAHLKIHSSIQQEDSNGDQVQILISDLPCGIYWGFGRIGTSSSLQNNEQDTSNNKTSALGHVYTTALSIGYNPTYGNDQKTIEPHFIAPESDSRRHASSCSETVLQDFYDQPIRLSVVGYMRNELPFEGLEKLIEAIKNDISHAVELAEKDDHVAQIEKMWVGSDFDSDS